MPCQGKGEGIGFPNKVSPLTAFFPHILKKTAIIRPPCFLRYLPLITRFKNIGTLEAAKAVIDEAPLIPAYEKQFQQEAVIRTVHYGTRIEGNDLTYQDVAKLVEGRQVTAADRDIQEVINYRNVIKYLEEIWATFDAGLPLPEEKYKEGTDPKNRPFFYSESIIKKIHELTTTKIIDEADIGKYRRQQVVLKTPKPEKLLIDHPQPLKSHI